MVLVGTVLALALVLLVGALLIDRAYDGKVPAGYRAAGAAIGGLSKKEAAAKLAEIFGANYGEVVLTVDGQAFTATASELGIQLDAEASLAQAMSQVPSGSFFERALFNLRGWIVGTEVPLVLVMDEDVLRRYLEDLATKVNADAVPAQVRYQGGSWEVTPSASGRRLRIDEAVMAIREMMSRLGSGPVTLPVDTLEPAITTSVAQQLAARAAEATSGPLILKAKGLQWTIPVEDLGQHMVFTADPIPALALQRDWLDQLLAEIAKELSSPTREPIIAWEGGHVVVKDPGKPGQALDTAGALERISAAINSGIHEVELPVNEVRPRVSPEDVPSLGIQELIAVGRSHFRGSAPERAHNIRVAASYLNGILIAPGETFSFNSAVGEISPARGYQEGYTIVADRTVRGIGGGVCQLSTTVFRAAFWAGLPIIERNPHIYRVGWYEEGGDPVGLDAAIYQPGADLKFINDTGHYILVQTSTDNGILTVYFYGTKPQRTVKMEGPYISNRQPAPEDVYEIDPSLPEGTKRQVEWAKEGMDVTIYRVIYQDGQLVRKDTFFSRYSPWPNMFRVSPDMAPSAQATPTPTTEPTPAQQASPTQTATPTR